jgi:hypothetical protein
MFNDSLLDHWKEQVRAAVAAERERCAKIAENFYMNDIGKSGPRPTIQQAIAAAIRNED